MTASTVSDDRIVRSKPTRGHAARWLALAMLLSLGCSPPATLPVPHTSGSDTGGSRAPVRAEVPGASSGLAEVPVGPSLIVSERTDLPTVCRGGPSAGDEVLLTMPPHEVVIAADGSVWFSHQMGFGRLKPDCAQAEIVMLPVQRGYLRPIVVLDDGLLLGDENSSVIWSVRLDPRAERIEIHPKAITPVPVPTGSAHGLSRDPDGTLWVTGYCQGLVGRRDPAGAWHLYRVGGCVEGIASRGDGRAFVANYGSNSIHVLDTAGAVQTVPIPGSCHPHTATAAPDGRVFFGCHAGGIIELRTDGSLARHVAGASMVLGIGVDAQGRVWFAASGAHRIGMLEAKGGMTWIDPKTRQGYPFGIAVGRDDAVWYTLESGKRLGRAR